MALISRKEIEGLCNIHGPVCISIFIPTHQSGEEVLKRKDSLALKNQLKEVRLKLSDSELNPKEIEELLSPAQALLDDKKFWRYLSDGLALFISSGFYKQYTLPIGFKAFNQVAEDFYLKPLMPMFVGEGSFYILALELERVRLFESTKHAVDEIIIEDVIPARLEERVGYDYEQKGIQFKGQNPTYGAATFHGHAEADRDRENEILRYFRSVDKGLMTLIGEEHKPMIIASQDYLFPIYKKANTYKYLLDEAVSCNLSESDKLTLHQLAWNIMEPVFNRERKEHMGLFEQYEGTGRTSSTIENVVPSAVHGKVAALFLQRGEEIWGSYDATTDKVTIQEGSEPSNISLLNLAAVKTFLNGGKVYLMEKEAMPNPKSVVNALYRY